MRILISLISFLFTLAGCNPQPGVTTMTFSSVDGVGVNSTKARIGAGDARFECLKSATGSCHYVVFVSDCKEDTAKGGCTTRVIERFTLPAGERRDLSGLPSGSRHCLSHQAMPVAPDCRES
jgi:hypothetical protein